MYQCALKYYTVASSYINRPITCSFTTSDPIIVPGAINYLDKGFPVKIPLSYQEIKSSCTSVNPLNYTLNLSCK